MLGNAAAGSWAARAAAATAIYCFLFNLAIALGALASSVAVDAMGVESALWIGTVLALLVLPTLQRATLPKRNPS